ncbi:hypothetical protein ACJRPK_12545 [Aquimarina sp. 2-A2]|uniref:hypothetical protein n=1 Tax=Aquimarina sp. 2-A2 TaxID=3382644 RepID=UPI00387EEFB4
MKCLVYSLIFLLGFILNAQQYNYTQLKQGIVVVQQNNFNYSNNSGLNLIAGAIDAFRNSWKDNKKRERNIAKAQAQLDLIKQKYSEIENYPDKIENGWHLVIVTDNYNYCAQAKVFTDNNRIQKFILDNYSQFDIPFDIISPIKNAKSMLSLHLSEDITDTVEVYFMSDLDAPNITAKPLEPGYVCFWSDLKKAKSVKIWLDKKYYGELDKRFEDGKPDCFEFGTISLALKPGTYQFKGAGRGTISWEGTIKIKENQCLTYMLNKENRR